MSKPTGSGLKKSVTSSIDNFRYFSPHERLKHLSKITNLSNQDFSNFSTSDSLSISAADGMIENVIGRIGIPVGIATNFKINFKDYLIPMAIEEPSVIAAASNMAKIIRWSGGFMASSDQPIMRAQIQILDIVDVKNTIINLKNHKMKIIRLANSKDKTLLKLGGGCKDIEIKSFNDTPVGSMVIVHLLVDVRDAMGANTVNTMAELVAPLIEKVSGGRVCLRILSNLADTRLSRASVKIPVAKLKYGYLSGADVAKRIIEASTLADIDPYRATTHNKGIMNGIDSVVLALGNDWRAIEAGAHAWAARDGKYCSLTKWNIDKSGYLLGFIELPMAVGLVGGATATNPVSKSCINLLGVQSSSELGQVLAAVGLAQNLAALRALSTEGIQRGHMVLHAKNIAISAGASGSEIESISNKMIMENNITIERASSLMNSKIDKKN